MKFVLILSSALIFSVVGNAAVGFRESERDSKFKSYDKSTYEDTEKNEVLPNNRSEELARNRTLTKVSAHEEHKVKNNKSEYFKN